MQPIMLQIAAPQIAGLLPARVTSRDNATYQYSDSRLATLSPAARRQLANATDVLLSLALACLSDPTANPATLSVGCMRFANDIAYLTSHSRVPTGIPAPMPAPLIPKQRYRTRAEMDAEVHTIIDQMQDRLAPLRETREVRYG